MASKAELDTNAVVFPQRCVNCGAPPTGTITVECIRGVDLVVVSYHKWLDFLLPVCSRCKWRRRLLGVLFGVGAMAAVVGSLFVMHLFLPLFEDRGRRDVWVFLTLVVFLAILYLARKWLTPLLDTWFLGVRGLRLKKGEKSKGTLWFRDDSFAEEIRQDTAGTTADGS